MELTEQDLNFLERVTPGNAAIYRLNGEKFETLCISPSLPALNGMAMEEYRKLSGDDASLLVFPPDRAALMSAVQQSLRTGETLECNFRAVHAQLGLSWTHVSARGCGEMDGCPVFLAIYTNASAETDIYQSILDHTDRKVYVYDRDTYEILFANRAARGCGRRPGKPYHGSKCYEYLFDRTAPCEECFMRSHAQGSASGIDRFSPERCAWERLTGNPVDWCGHDAFVQYIDDVTDSRKRQRELEDLVAAHRIQMQAIQILNGQGSIDARIQAALACMLEYYGTDRVYVFSFDPGEKTVSNSYECCRKGVSSQRAFLQKVDMRYMARWMDTFRRQEVLAQEDLEQIRESWPDEYEIMSRQGIHSFIEAPIFANGQLLGFVGADNPPMEKMMHTSDLLLAFAYSIGSALVKDQSEAENRQSRQMYETAAELANLGVWIYDIPNRRITLSDSRATREDCTIFSIPKVIENIPESMLKWIDERDIPTVLKMYQAIDGGAASASCEYRYRQRPGTPARFERAFYTTVFDEQGRPVSAYGIGMDVTALKQEEEKYNSMFQLVAKVNPDSLGTFHLNLTKNLCSDGQSPFSSVLRQQSSGTADGYLEANCAIIADEEHKAAYREQFTREKMLEAFQSGKTELFQEYPIFSSAGAILWIDGFVTMVQNPATHDVEAITYALNVTQRKKDEEIRQRLTNEIIDYIGLIDLDGKTFEFSNVNKKIVGLPVGKKIDYTVCTEYDIRTFVAPGDRQNFRDQTRLSHLTEELEKAADYIFSYDHAEEGKLFRKQLQYAYLNERRREILVVQSDITAAYQQEQEQMRRLQEALSGAETANAAKSDFLSRMSHDIRTPLNGIIGMTYLAREESDREKVAGYLAKIDTSSKFLLGLVNDILDMSKAESGKIDLQPEPYYMADFTSYIDAVIRPLCESKNQTLTFEVHPVRNVVPLLDILRTNQIYFNLLSNAVKYTPEGGRICVTVAESITPQNKDRISVSVRDNGIGISEKFQKILFEPFTQEGRNDNSEMRGSGLGLAIVKKTIDAMGGTIRVKSRVGEGAEFLFVIECDYVTEKNGGGKPQTAPAEDPAEQLNGRHILLCEDHPLNQEIAKTLLTRKNILVDIAENGQAGVEHFAASAIHYYDAVLMDIRMPVMDGYEATRAIRALDRPDAKTVPIIAMTADAFEQSAREAKAAGMTAYVTKPIEPGTLFAVLRDSLSS